MKKLILGLMVVLMAGVPTFAIVEHRVGLEFLMQKFSLLSNHHFMTTIIVMTFLMCGNMLRIRKKLKIFNPIIKGISINMMNYLGGFKFTSNMIRHNESMFKYPFLELRTLVLNFYINIRFITLNMYSFATNRFFTLRNNISKLVFTSFRTAFYSICITRIDMKRLVTNYTILLNPFMVRIFTLPRTIFSSFSIFNYSKIFFPTKLTISFYHIIIVYILLGILSNSNPVYGGGKYGWEVTKIVNGGYETAMLVDQNAQSQLPFLPGAYFRTKLAFISPRDNLFKWDHNYFRLAVGGNFTLIGGKVELETGLTDYWARNGIPEEVIWENSARWMWNWE